MRQPPSDVETKLSDLVEVSRLGDRHDERGWVVEPIADPVLSESPVLNLHVVATRPGHVRGNHVHARRTEVVCVLGGRFRVVFVETASGRKAEREVAGGEHLGFVIPPGVAHAFEALGPEDGYLLSYADRVFDPSDVERLELVGS